MAVQVIPRQERGSLSTALIITRRELRDSLRDWRIVTPIIVLTVIFPFLMDFTSRWATTWVSQYTDPILVERINPFLLMIVGFFPISFSLIIALESFVGEKERNSLEPILSMPVSDLELYLGKMLSSLLLPLMAGYLGITVFLVTRVLTTPRWIPPLDLAILMFMLTTVEALVMVSGAVVVSSQTTSVRAANLLASFINDVARSNKLQAPVMEAECAGVGAPSSLADLDAAILAFDVPRTTALANAYLAAGGDRDAYRTAVALTACKFQDDPHNQKITHSSFEEYAHNSTHLRDRLLLASTRLLAGWPKMPGERECFARFEKDWIDN
jgi:hypothetical protein